MADLKQTGIRERLGTAKLPSFVGLDNQRESSPVGKSNWRRPAIGGNLDEASHPFGNRIMHRSCLLVFIVLLFVGLPVRAAAVPEEAIRAAVERGAAALRKTQGPDGRFAIGGNGTGSTSLAALTLIECGVSPDDEQIRKAVAAVRADCPTQTLVYSLSLAIMLFDRVGDPLDVPITHELAVRLLEGQRPDGGWHYATTDSLDESDVARLRRLVERRAELKTVPDPGKPGSRPPLSPELAERIKRADRRGIVRTNIGLDNSNTQFAILAAWIARRNGVPTDSALRRAEAYFRATHTSGSWPYYPGGDPDNGFSNTCSGLLGLAIGAGLSREAHLKATPDGKLTPDGKPTRAPVLRDPLKDPLVQAAMNAVGARVAELAASGLDAQTNSFKQMYFLWSVERVGMVYSVPAMGGVNWYQVGAAAILRVQLPNGLWPTGGKVRETTISYEVNTCFALLFLQRANFASDLTSNLLKKPNQPTLRSGNDKGEPPPAPELTHEQQLVRELLTASAERQVAILAELRDGKGPEFTDALAHVIPKLDGDIQKKARDALAERLARMTSATIRAKLKDAAAEVRRASALACAMKEDRAAIPDLIATLDDKDPWVVRAAAVGLRSLTGQDFGPSATATAEERTKAVAAWKAWWKKAGGT
jgi:hypothetical protein